MVVCKYYRQGNCRYGQYCQFEHINTFGTGNKGDSYEDEITAIAKEVLFAERGGQWLLSCFGPWQDGPCIPGMEDVSPEEVRWEMYQAQKNGMIEQAKLRFQQLCQDMKAKRDALKNPNRETIAMLKKVIATVHKNLLNASGNAAGKTSNFSFATPQLGLPSSTSGSSVFGNKTFGTQSNPFSGSFTSPSNSSIFGRPNTTTNPIFGGTPTFENNLGGFGNTPNSSSVFGGTTNTTTFNTGQNAQTFGQVAQQGSSMFGGGTSQSVFRQSNAFGGTSQMNNVFGRPQTAQTATSVFDSGATASTSLFNSPITSQSNSPLFSGAKTSTANPFGGSSTMQNSNPVFGTTAPSGSFSSGIFSQSKTLPAFRNTLPFGSNFSNNTGSIFGGQATFGTSTATTSNIFGTPSTTTSTFGTPNQIMSTFEINPSASTPSIFGGPQNTGTIMSAANSTPFATSVPATSSGPFVTTASQFGATSTTAAPFSRTTFGLSTGSTGETFATTVTSSAAPFGATNTGVTFGTANPTTSPFTTSTFGDVKSSPFASTNTTVTTTTTNPFAPRGQQTISPFGNVPQNQTCTTVTVSSSGPFGKSPFGSTVMTSVIDESVYTIEGQLTDDEKSMYLAEKFIFGKIPLKPPTKDIR